MTAMETHGTQDPKTFYLELLATLQAEIKRTTSAIVRNDIATFEQSLEEQQVLCSQMKSLVELMVRGMEFSSVQVVKTETAGLQHLVRTYAVLLEHAEGNARQLFRLCRTYTA